MCCERVRLTTQGGPRLTRRRVWAVTYMFTLYVHHHSCLFGICGYFDLQCEWIYMFSSDIWVTWWNYLGFARMMFNVYTTTRVFSESVGIFFYSVIGFSCFGWWMMQFLPRKGQNYPPANRIDVYIVRFLISIYEGTRTLARLVPKIEGFPGFDLKWKIIFRVETAF